MYQLYQHQPNLINTMKAAIYHFTNSSNKRPSINQKQLNNLNDYAMSLGCDDVEIFCDKSHLICERSEFNKMLSSIKQFDLLITKDFFHINKNTSMCMNIVKQLKDIGIHIYTLENGKFTWIEAPFDQPLKIATYCCRFGTINEMKQIIAVNNDVLKMYATKKTEWTVIDQYFDESQYQNDGEQPELKKLIQNKDRYDLLLVHNFNDIHWRTANFCKVRKQLHLDIYSLQEGFLKYNKEII